MPLAPAVVSVGQRVGQHDDERGGADCPAQQPRLQRQRTFDAARFLAEVFHLGELAAHALEAVVGVEVSARACLDAVEPALEIATATQELIKLDFLAALLTRLECLPALV